MWVYVCACVGVCVCSMCMYVCVCDRYVLVCFYVCVCCGLFFVGFCFCFVILRIPVPSAKGLTSAQNLKGTLVE